MDKNLDLLFQDLLQDLTVDERNKFFSLANVCQIPSRQVIFTPGDICTKMWFLVDGAVRMFRENKGKDSTLHIITSARFFTDFVSIKSQIPANYSFETLIPSTIMEFDVREFYGLLEYSLNFERVGRKILEIVLYQETSRLDDLVFLDATERYQKLLESNPIIFQKIPLKYVASYLKISPETLSRIRNS
jgi:CRP-like cAMP-binding protein